MLQELHIPAASSPFERIKQLRLALESACAQSHEAALEELRAAMAAREEALRIADARVAAAERALAEAEGFVVQYVPSAAASNVAASEPGVEPVVEPAAVSKPPSPKKVAAPQKAPSANKGPTVPERVAAVMGDKVWDAGSVLEALAGVGDEILKSNNPRSYVLTTLSAAVVNIQGPDGHDLCDSSGKRIKVKKFIAVGKGRYRVATQDELEQEALRLAGAGANPEPKAEPEVDSDVENEPEAYADPEPISDPEVEDAAAEVFKEQGLQVPLNVRAITVPH